MGVYVNVWGDLSVHDLCVRVSVCVPGLYGAFPVLSCLRLVLYPGSTLSAQSVPTMHPGQLALLAPGGLADSASSTLLQPLKPSPSSDNLCSAYTSEAALSVPSLCAPTPGRRAAHSPRLQAASSATTQQLRRNLSHPNNALLAYTERQMHAVVCLDSLTAGHSSPFCSGGLV